ncbi:anthranilate phosphoribosyltransferase [Mesocricetibacter intestinalis]|uniref:Anthranilate phosphoribosyltransferase n=1 Tax=Mesocricetibacter intestinalis TaxID=1521930 RepID=A0A4V3D9Y0_9PAST|nr:anthranilate phosphoribosyltransferase [Mesocricetibacter intestinalis]TDQ59082.1 anthranilate phosphoribosyltransferase [Mesocricetibacter intestinalis]
MQTEHILSKLFEQSSLNRSESNLLFSAIVNGELSSEQLAGALIALKLRGESAEEISGAVSALLDNSQPFDIPNYPFADIVGTGGDCANTINISTASAIVAASMDIKIAKHGNRSVSSKTGASDVLSRLGVNISMSAQQARKALDEINLCFLFAQQYHLGFKYAAPARQALKTRTIFNILGPLINPARPKRQLLGVYSPDLLRPYAETAVRLGHKHTIVVHGCGLDEVAIHGKTEVAEVYNGKIEYYRLSPSDFGFNPQPLESLRGGDPEQNAAIITALLQGKGQSAHAQAVAMNTALVFKLFGKDNLKQNAAEVLACLADGKAYQTLEKLTHY